MKKLFIDPETLEGIQAHLKLTYPNEGVGFLYGQETEDREITQFLPVKNTKEGDQRRRFEVSPLDYLRAEEHASENDLTLLGIYHSHPDHPAWPSEHDLKSAMPFFSYLIVSLRKGVIAETTSWQLDDQGAFQEEEIQFEAVLEAK